MDWRIQCFSPQPSARRMNEMSPKLFLCLRFKIYPQAKLINKLQKTQNAFSKSISCCSGPSVPTAFSVTTTVAITVATSFQKPIPVPFPVSATKPIPFSGYANVSSFSFYVCFVTIFVFVLHTYAIKHVCEPRKLASSAVV